jgi:hypothetical protein
METAPLGPLGYAVLEQYRELAQAAVGNVLARLRAELPPDGGPPVVGYVYDERDVGRTPLQAGNWVTLGVVTAGETTTFVEVNVGTGAVRERRL